MWWRVSIDRVVMGVLFGVSFLGHLALARRMSGPIIQTDEVGYLGEANLFGHGVGLLYQTVPYHPGYGFLLAPVAAFTSTPGVLYRWALLLNAVALASIAVAAYLLARHIIHGRSPAACAAVAILVSLYPAFIGYGNVATEASVFISACAFAAVAVAWASAGGGTWRWAVAGVLAGACFCLHPIGPAVVVAVVVAAGLLRQRRNRRVAAVAFAIAGAQVMTVVTIVLNRRIVDYTKHHLLNPGVVPKGAAPKAQAVITRSANLLNTYRRPTGNLTALGYEAAGQSWYLAVATGGIAIIGAGVALRGLWRVGRGRSTTPGDAVGAFVAVFAALGFATSVHHWLLGVNGGPQSDMLIYGRFNEHLLAPVLVLGLCELHALRRSPKRLAVLGWTAGTVLLIGGGGWLIQHGRTAAALRRPAVTFNVLGIEPVIHRLGFINVALISVIGASAMVIAVVLATEWGLLLVTPLVAAAWLAIGLSGSTAMVHDSLARTDQRVVLHAVGLVEARIGHQACIAYDRSVETQWTLDTDQVFLPHTLMHPFDSRVGERPCSAVVISDRLDLASAYPGARLMAAENYETTRLWVLPGIVQYRLAVAGLLLPAGFPAALPDSAMHSMIDPEVRPPTTVAPGGTVILPVRVRNAGTGSPWPSRYGLAGSKTGWVALVMGWSKVGAPPPLHRSDELGKAQRLDLTQPLWPGEQMHAPLGVRAVDEKGQPLAPGRYLLHVEMVQEGFTFFVDQADRPLDIAVTVG